MAHITGLFPTNTHNGITSADGGDMPTCWPSTGTNQSVVWLPESDASQRSVGLISGVPAGSIVLRRSRLIKENRNDATIPTTDLQRS